MYTRSTSESYKYAVIYQYCAPELSDNNKKGVSLCNTASILIQLDCFIATKNVVQVVRIWPTKIFCVMVFFCTSRWRRETFMLKIMPH